MQKYVTNGKIQAKVDSGMNDGMLERMTVAMKAECKREGMATDEQDVIAQ